MKPGKNEIRRSGGNGRYSSCVAYGGVLYTRGVTAVNLEAGIRGQAKDVFEQLDRLMAFSNTNKNRVLSATIYLKDMADYANFNAEWDLWISDGNEPVRSVVQAGLALEEYRLKVALTVALEE